MRFKLRSFELGPEQREYQQPSSLFSFGNKTPSAPTTHPAYNALSYTWGSPEKTSFIVVNGSQFPVTPNLEAALRRLHGTVQYLWVDAICINQDDIHERNSQVSLMRSIYKTASRVCVWLGEEADDSALAMDAIAKLANAPHRAPGQAIQPYATPSNEQKLQTWSALWALFQRPWFSRVWVRQEIALGSDVGFYCGQHSCNYNDLEFAVRGMDWLYGEIGYHPSPAVRTLDILNPPYHYFKLIDKVTTLVDHGRQFAPLEDLLANTQSCNATDSRDKIYAVLGLADPEIYNIKPDYGRPPRETYMAATRRMVEGSNSLSVLNVSPNPHRVHGLPSWVPDFSGERKMRPIPQPPSKGHFSEPKRIEFVSKAQKQCLQVEGDLIDQVRAVSDWLISTSDDDDRLHKIFAQWRTFVRQADVRAAPSGNGLFGHASSWKRLVGETLDSKISDSLAEEEWLSFLSLKGGSLGFKFGFQTGSREHTRIQSAAQTLLLPEGYSPKPKPYPSLYRYMRQNAFGRRICLTHRCEVALVSDEAKVGDKLCLLHGNPVVLLLRKEGSAHTLVGDACMFLSLPHPANLLTMQQTFIIHSILTNAPRKLTKRT